MSLLLPAVIPLSIIWQTFEVVNRIIAHFEKNLKTLSTLFSDVTGDASADISSVVFYAFGKIKFWVKWELTKKNKKRRLGSLGLMGLFYSSLIQC